MCKSFFSLGQGIFWSGFVFCSTWDTLAHHETTCSTRDTLVQDETHLFSPINENTFFIFGWEKSTGGVVINKVLGGVEVRPNVHKLGGC